MANHKDGRGGKIGVRMPVSQIKSLRYLADEIGVTFSDVLVTAVACALADPVLSGHLRSELGKLRPTPKEPSGQPQKGANVRRKRTPQASAANRATA